ncbi:hypothetical protein GE061_009465 [Apolygus lucorum]|uniref:Uncharacterized protein n=1 Tax=Apolygus lucorum TaxID=248454 RepID=A0A6A4KIJ8_APOLU|nr:hypothetical protein GE061_009465 [Apolygus lucorum]
MNSMKSNFASKVSQRYSTKSRILRLSSKRRKPGPKKKMDKLQNVESKTPENHLNLKEHDSGNLETNLPGEPAVDGPVLVSAQSLNLPHTIHYSSNGHHNLPLHTQIAKGGETRSLVKCESILSDTYSMNMSFYPEVVSNSPAPLSECSPQPSGSTSVPTAPDPVLDAPLGGKTIQDVARTVTELQSKILHLGAVIHDHALQINELRQGRDSSHERILTLEKNMSRILTNQRRQTSIEKYPFNPNIAQILFPQ